VQILAFTVKGWRAILASDTVGIKTILCCKFCMNVDYMWLLLCGEIDWSLAACSSWYVAKAKPAADRQTWLMINAMRRTNRFKLRKWARLLCLESYVQMCNSRLLDDNLPQNPSDLFGLRSYTSWKIRRTQLRLISRGAKPSRVDLSAHTWLSQMTSWHTSRTNGSTIQSFSPTKVSVTLRCSENDLMTNGSGMDNGQWSSSRFTIQASHRITQAM
jgi:hypothetical protein